MRFLLHFPKKIFFLLFLVIIIGCTSNTTVLELTVEDASNSEVGYTYRLKDIEVIQGDIEGSSDMQVMVIVGESDVDLWHGEANDERARITLGKRIEVAEDDLELYFYGTGTGAPVSHHFLTFNENSEEVDLYEILDAQWVANEKFQTQFQEIIEGFDGETIVEEKAILLTEELLGSNIFEGYNLEYPAQIGEIKPEDIKKNRNDNFLLRGQIPVYANEEIYWYFTVIKDVPTFIFDVPSATNAEGSTLYVFKNGVVTKLFTHDDAYFQPMYFTEVTNDDLKEGYFENYVGYVYDYIDGGDSMIYRSLTNLDDQLDVVDISPRRFKDCAFRAVIKKNGKSYKLEYYPDTSCNGANKHGFYLDEAPVAQSVFASNYQFSTSLDMYISPDFDTLITFAENKESAHSSSATHYVILWDFEEGKIEFLEAEGLSRPRGSADNTYTGFGFRENKDGNIVVTYPSQNILKSDIYVKD